MSIFCKTVLKIAARTPFCLLKNAILCIAKSSIADVSSGGVMFVLTRPNGSQSDRFCAASLGLLVSTRVFGGIVTSLLAEMFCIVFVWLHQLLPRHSDRNQIRLLRFLCLRRTRPKKYLDKRNGAGCIGRWFRVQKNKIY